MVINHLLITHVHLMCNSSSRFVWYEGLLDILLVEPSER